MVDGTAQPQADQAAQTSRPTPYLLRLFVCGQTMNSIQAIRNLTRLLERELPNIYELEIIDVLQQPSMAEREHILATPTLIRVHPPPMRRIIGDLSDRERVLNGLDLGNHVS